MTDKTIFILEYWERDVDGKWVCYKRVRQDTGEELDVNPRVDFKVVEFRFDTGKDS